MQLISATMKTFRTLRGIARRDKFASFSSNGAVSAACRRFATAAPSTDTLPLAGVRVLDMTRVLAGVSLPFFFFP